MKFEENVTKGLVENIKAEYVLFKGFKLIEILKNEAHLIIM